LLRVVEGEEIQRESRRKERVDETNDKLRRHKAEARERITAPPEVDTRTITGLCDGITLEPGHLSIEFAGAEDLLSKLYEFSQAASYDFDRFRAAVEPAGQR